MGVLPKDFYSMEFSDFWLMRLGFINKKCFQRRLAYLSAAPWLDKSFDITKAVPLWGDEKRKKQVQSYISERNQEILKTHRERKVQYKKIDGIIKQIISD